ncbi:hypothetical protein MBANPS3_006085 [Mucor bainieri]
MSNHNNSSHADEDGAIDDGTIPLTQHRLALELKSHPVRGRGVFTREPIERNVLVEISPILLFNAEEYESYGKYTVLDQYTYCWQGGFALALGLGSMFNHNSAPNVGFIRDIPNKLIRYDEELCISYGNHLWFEDESNAAAAAAAVSDSEDEPFPFQDSSEDEEYL